MIDFLLSLQDMIENLDVCYDFWDLGNPSLPLYHKIPINFPYWEDSPIINFRLLLRHSDWLAFGDAIHSQTIFSPQCRKTPSNFDLKKLICIFFHMFHFSCQYSSYFYYEHKVKSTICDVVWILRWAYSKSYFTSWIVEVKLC